MRSARNKEAMAIDRRRSAAAKKGAATRRRKKAEAERVEREHAETWDEYAATKKVGEPRRQPRKVRAAEHLEGVDYSIATENPLDEPHVDAAKLEAERRFATEYGPAVTGASMDPAARLVAVQKENMELERTITRLKHELAVARKDLQEARTAGMKAEAQLTKQERVKFSRDRQKLNMIRRVLAL